MISHCERHDYLRSHRSCVSIDTQRQEVDIKSKKKKVFFIQVRDLCRQQQRERNYYYHRWFLYFFGHSMCALLKRLRVKKYAFLELIHLWIQWSTVPPLSNGSFFSRSFTRKIKNRRRTFFSDSVFKIDRLSRFVGEFFFLNNHVIWTLNMWEFKEKSEVNYY